MVTISVRNTTAMKILRIQLGSKRRNTKRVPIQIRTIAAPCAARLSLTITKTTASSTNNGDQDFHGSINTIIGKTNKLKFMTGVYLRLPIEPNSLGKIRLEINKLRTTKSAAMLNQRIFVSSGLDIAAVQKRMKQAISREKRSRKRNQLMTLKVLRRETPI